MTGRDLFEKFRALGGLDVVCRDAVSSAQRFGDWCDLEPRLQQAWEDLAAWVAQRDKVA